MKGPSSMLLSIERAMARVLKIAKDKLDLSCQVYVQQRVPEYREMWRAVAKEIGAEFRMLTDELWELEFEGKTTRVLNYKLEFDNPVTLEMAGMKPLIYRLMKENGLCPPDHLLFCLEQLNQANRFLKSYPRGCVVKPASGTSSGLGVTTHIRTPRELRQAAILASLYCRELIIEPLIPGESYRVLVLNGKVVHAVRRRGPRLSGDGVLKISALVKAENVRRGISGDPKLDVDRDCLFTLGYQGLSLDSVPEKGRVFIVKSVNNPIRKRVEVRTIYNEAVTELICSSIKKDAESAARILRSEFAGVDFITPDPTVPLEKCGGVISEVNTTPGLHHHYDLKVERFPRAAVEAVSVLLKRGC